MSFLTDRRWRLAVTAASCAVLLAFAPPVGAASEGLSKSAQEAASLDELRATDDEILAALSALDTEVVDQQGLVDDAQRGVAAADQALATKEQELSGAQQRIDGLSQVASARAVEQYMRPNDNALDHMLSADGFAHASRRTALLAEVNDRDADAIDQFRAARREIEIERKAAIAAKRSADERRSAEEEKLNNLRAAQAEKQRVDASLKERIAAYAAEDEASARVQASVASTDRASRGGGGGGDGRVSSAGLRWPVKNPKVTSPFGTRWGRLHAGIDIDADTGTPIYAANGGKVTQAGRESGYGNYTCIDHGGGFETCYAHQSSMAVSVGSTVQAGDQIGRAGNTGASQGAHLHFETRVNGSPRNPQQYLP